ncbi:MAG: GNAT family N-acetyltransferase [Anaerolineales bacterium]|nr:MAG: GNAT family N-acetyltransferase [Anaerolineales bacterium]
MIEIKPLTHLLPQDIRRLNYGYTSSEVYKVSKKESPATTTIHLERVVLAQPYIKKWVTDDEELKLLQEAVATGFSLGAYASLKDSVLKEMIGIAIAEPRHWNSSLWVWEFHVSPVYQRQGIGSHMMQSLIQKAERAGLRILVCETQNTNAPAIAFYRTMGFEIDGIDLSYYTNQDLVSGEVAFFMKYKIGRVKHG